MSFQFLADVAPGKSPYDMPQCFSASDPVCAATSSNTVAVSGDVTVSNGTSMPLPPEVSHPVPATLPQTGPGLDGPLYSPAPSPHVPWYEHLFNWWTALWGGDEFIAGITGLMILMCVAALLITIASPVLSFAIGQLIKLPRYLNDLIGYFVKRHKAYRRAETAYYAGLIALTNAVAELDVRQVKIRVEYLRQTRPSDETASVYLDWTNAQAALTSSQTLLLAALRNIKRGLVPFLRSLGYYTKLGDSLCEATRLCERAFAVANRIDKRSLELANQPELPSVREENITQSVVTTLTAVAGNVFARAHQHVRTSLARQNRH